MAFPGFNPFGQVRVQLRMVWHRYRRNGSSRMSSRYAGRLVAAVSQPAPGLKKCGGSEEAIAISTQWLGQPEEYSRSKGCTRRK